MNILGKIAAAVLLLACAGPPILETWEALWLAAAMLGVLLGRSVPDRRRLAMAGAVVLSVIAVKAVLPRADLAEGHNAFLVTGDDGVLERGLPPVVFDSWRRQFDGLYPPDREPYDPVRSQWRTAGGPDRLFAPSSDAIWRPAQYSRQVDDIRFRSLAEFRGGFANELQYNFWTGELRREEMPFYVMYELTPASVGSRLTWLGQVFWERPDGSFEEVVHRLIDSRTIEPSDAGRRVYAAFFPQRDPDLLLELALSPRLRVARAIEGLLTLLGGIAVLALTIRLRWRSYGRALAICSAAYAFMAAFLAVSQGKYLGYLYPPHGGGDDGLANEGWGRMMAMALGRGDVGDALMGGEPVYWFTPGTRYIRMAEKLVFGDTNHLFGLAVACVPLVLFYLVRHLAGARWAWVATLGFIVMVVGNPSYLQYIANAKLGYGEAMAAGLFLLGLTLLLRAQPAWGGARRGLAAVVVAGAALAGAMFVRPNFALAVVWLGGAFAFTAFRQRDYAAAAAVATGLAFALWMPFHNWYFGGAFHLISGSGAIAMPLGPGDYVRAAADAATGRFDTAAVTTASSQLAGWLWNPGFLVRPELIPMAWMAHVVALLSLGLACAVALSWVARRLPDQSALGVVAVASIVAHAPMLFIFTTHYRYAMLGWDLSMIVLIACLSRLTSVPFLGRRAVRAEATEAC